MKVRLVITKDGKVAAFVPQGTLAEGKEKIKKVLEGMVDGDITFVEDVNDVVDRIERHRHDDPEWEKEHSKNPHIHFDGSMH